MPRGRSLARKRRARVESGRAEFQQKRDDPEALVDLLRRVADSDQCVWAIARPAKGDRPLDEMELAMIAQTAAPPLAGKTPGSVHRRHEFSRRTKSTREQEAGTAGDVSGLTPKS
jgi:hypothetical protein